MIICVAGPGRSSASPNIWRRARCNPDSPALFSFRPEMPEFEMKAVVLREHGEDGLHYETGFRDPTPGAGDVVVRVRAASLNYHDIFTRRGIPGIKIPMPAIMGLDVAGEIVALGRAFRAGRSATVCSAIRSTGSRAGSPARPCMAGSPNIAG